jgi:hypothetical protein
MSRTRYPFVTPLGWGGLKSSIGLLGLVSQLLPLSLHGILSLSPCCKAYKANKLAIPSLQPFGRQNHILQDKLGKEQALGSPITPQR